MFSLTPTDQLRAPRAAESIGRIVVNDVMPFNQALWSLVIVLLLAINPVRTDCSDPVHLATGLV